MVKYTKFNYCHGDILDRVPLSGKKHLENYFFQVREKFENFNFSGKLGKDLK